MADPDATVLVQRVTEIEVRLAFVDDAVAALTQADAQRSQRLIRIERMLTELREELQSLGSVVGHDPGDEPPPPHY